MSSRSVKHNRLEHGDGFGPVPVYRSDGTLGAALHGFTGQGILDGSWGTVQGAGSLVGVLDQLRGKESIETPYWQDPWIFATIDKIAQAAASTTLRFRQDRSPDAEPVPADDPIYELFRRPHPSLSQVRFIRHLTALWWIYGEIPLALRRGPGRDWIVGGGAPLNLASLLTARRRERIQFFPIKPDCAELLFDEQSTPTTWRVNAVTGGHESYVDVPYDAVAHVYEPDPMDVMFLRGMGRLEAVLRTASIDWSAERYAEADVRTGGVPNIVLFAKGASEEQVRKLRSDIERNHQQPSAQGKAMVLGGKDYEIHFPGHSPKEMAWVELRRWNRESKIAVLGGNPAWLGITDDVNRANAEQGRKSAWEDTVSPFLERLAGEIQDEVLPMLGGAYSEMGVSFDTTKVKALREDATDQANRVKTYFDMGVFTLEEAFLQAGVEMVEGVTGAGERKPQPQPMPGAEGEEDVPPRRNAIDLNEFPIGRAAASAQFVDQTSGAELSIRKRTSRVLSAYVDRAIALARDAASEGKTFAWTVRHELGDLDLESLLPDILPWQTRLGEAVTPIERALFQAQAKYIADAMGASRLVSLTDPAAIEFLTQKEIALKETLVTLRDAVRSVLERSLRDSNAVGTLADQIRQSLEMYRADLKVMQDNLGARAELIARTETTSIANGARVMEAGRQGVSEMRWITARDPHVRASHAALDGTVRPLGDVFAHGLRWPGDPQAPISETANCRCTVAPTARPRSVA